jgi:hypothetical protein
MRALAEANPDYSRSAGVCMCCHGLTRPEVRRRHSMGIDFIVRKCRATPYLRVRHTQPSQRVCISSRFVVKVDQHAHSYTVRMCTKRTELSSRKCTAPDFSLFDFSVVTPPFLQSVQASRQRIQAGGTQYCLLVSVGSNEYNAFNRSGRCRTATECVVAIRTS